MIKKRSISICLIVLFIMSNCAAKKHYDTSQNWISVAKMEDSEIFADPASIKREGSMIFAREKKIFSTQASKDEYLANIKKKLNKENEILKWDDFSYTVYYSEYDCINRRFRILTLEDYDSQGLRIVKTTPNKNNIVWLNVGENTIGDYTFFFVCDYDN